LKFPVNFISIEEELAPLAQYFKGRVLNAGCGDRDITAVLKNWHASTVDNCDIQSSIPGAFCCDLTSIPRPDGSYDAILCNAVLEHVPDPEKVMGEFRRLLAPQGYLVVSVPFLQPFHPTPFDFRRYTRTGLEQLGQRAGFRVVEMLSIHSLAQTMGWLLWAHLEERQSTIGKLLCWLPIYLASLFFQRAANGRTCTANSFQAVMVKAE
jgi:SAM-dependent methyltransferase